MVQNFPVVNQAAGGLVRGGGQPAPQAQPQEAPQEAPEGQPADGYTGDVMFEGTNIKVFNGLATVNGEKYYFAEDGSYVFDIRRDIVGYVKDGELVEMDDEQEKVLQAAGVIQEGEDE